MIDAQQFDQMWQGHTEIPAVVATGEQGRVHPKWRSDARLKMRAAIAKVEGR